MRHLAAGVSLLECMVGIAIIGILVGMVIPSLVRYHANNTIRDVAEELNLGLQQTKIEAITRNTSIDFVMTGSSWNIVLPASGTSTAQTLSSRSSRDNETQVVVVPTQNTIRFNGAGSITTANSYNIDISNPTQGGCAAQGGPIRCLRVTLTTAGTIKTCDPASADARAC
jgi:type IV fimbrial biogenesis protein FimT